MSIENGSLKLELLYYRIDTYYCINNSFKNNMDIGDEYWV